MDATEALAPVQGRVEDTEELEPGRPEEPRTVEDSVKPV